MNNDIHDKIYTKVTGDVRDLYEDNKDNKENKEKTEVDKKERKIREKKGIYDKEVDRELEVNKVSLDNRLPPKLTPDEIIKIKPSEYYMNNRKYFNTFITRLFESYKEQLIEDQKNASCERDEDGNFTIMTHQEIVRDYINVFSPYRGLLLYHGLGSGKTCSSIAITEGMKSTSHFVTRCGLGPPSLVDSACVDEAHGMRIGAEMIPSAGIQMYATTR